MNLGTRRPIIAVFVVLIGASSLSTFAATDEAAAAYLASQRDGVIRNWQSHVVDSKVCEQFIDRYKTEGQKFPTAASGKFVNAMTRVKKAAIAANCIKR
jgi:hypothetical protein